MDARHHLLLPPAATPLLAPTGLGGEVGKVELKGEAVPRFHYSRLATTSSLLLSLSLMTKPLAHL